MMNKRMGGTTMAAVLGVMGLAGMGVGGYSLMTGSSLCEMMSGTCGTAMACPESGGCDSKTVDTATVVEVANPAAGEAKSGGCCALGAALAVKKAGSCESASACSTGTKSSMKFVVMGSNMPVVMPAAFYRPASSFCTDSLVSKSGCGTSCGDKATQVINASNKAADEGCCKGTGVRADGKACCGGCDSDKAGATTVPASNAKTDGGCSKSCGDAAKTVPASNAKTDGGCSKSCDGEKKAEQTADAGR